MNGLPPPQSKQDRAGETARAEITRYFGLATEMRSQPRLRGVKGICQFDIVGAGSWYVAVNNGAVHVLDGADHQVQADCIVTCAGEDFLRILRGENYLNMLTAILQGLATISGDFTFGYSFLSRLVLPSPGVPTHGQRDMGSRGAHYVGKDDSQHP